MSQPSTERDATRGLADEKGNMTDSMDNLEDDSKLLTKVGAAMEAAFGDKVDDAPEPEQTEAKVEQEGALPEEIPYNYVRAAVRSGWTEDDIQKLADENPELAMQTMQNIFESTKTLSDQFSQLGRTVRDSSQQQEQQQDQQQEQQQEQKPFVDIEKLKEQYGNDPIIDSVIKPMSDALNQLRDTRSSNEQVMPNPVQQQQQAMPEELTAELDRFFGAESLQKHYGNFYGPGNVADDLTLGQIRCRQNVIEKADQIIAGANAQGIEMSVVEALESAHLLTSEPVRRAAIRTEIKDSAKKRSSGISLRPSKTTTNVAGAETKPRTDAELEAAVANRLDKMNWS